MESIEIRPVQNEAEQKALFYQRWLVLRKPLGMIPGTEQDQYEDDAFHLAAFYQGNIIGSARLRQLSEGLGTINYVCILLEFQSQGIGTQLMQKIIEVAQGKNFKCLRIKARINAVNFYQKLGFVVEAEEFELLGIPHRWMTLNLEDFSASKLRYSKKEQKSSKSLWLQTEI